MGICRSGRNPHLITIELGKCPREEFTDRSPLKKIQIHALFADRIFLQAITSVVLEHDSLILYY
jgi:hypothetical protein